MFKILYKENLFSRLKTSCNSLKRFFLSDGFKCTEAWENRLKAPMFAKVQFGNLYAGLDKVFTHGGGVSVLDVDIFISGIVEESYENELEHILEKLRANPETSIMYERTSHAAIRALLSWNNKDTLLNILSQRLVYGLFPDMYLNLLMIDTFLKQNDVISAVKVAVLEMLQEDSSHPVLNGLSLYSCIKYLNSPDAWVTPKKEIDEDEEVQKVRVDFARNEYYDDHFDIVDTNHLVGKTMYAFGKAVEGSIGTSCQLIGLVLYQKYDKAVAFVSYLMQNNLPIHREAVEKAKSYIQNKPKQSAEDEKPEESKPISETNEDSPIKTELLKLLDELNNKNLLPNSLDTALEEYVKKEVKEHEEMLIKRQCETYKKWEEDRAKNVAEEMAELKKKSVKMEIEELKEQLRLEEQRLFYYDNELEYDETVEEKKNVIENFRYFEPRKNKNKNKSSEISYIPPKITKRTT